MPASDVAKVVGLSILVILGAAALLWSGVWWFRDTLRVARRRGVVQRTYVTWLAGFVCVAPLAMAVAAFRATGTFIYVTGEALIGGITIAVVAACAIAGRVARGPRCGRCKGAGKVRRKSGEWAACQFCDGTGLRLMAAQSTRAEPNR
jgi:hypothetical protein